MAKTIHSDTSASTKKKQPVVSGSVLGERGTAAIESNPMGTKEEASEKKKKTGSRGYRSGAAPVYYESATIPTATAQNEYIDALYEAKLNRQRSALESAYENNVSGLDAREKTVAPRYQRMVDQAAGLSAVQQAAFREQAAATGLNSGARGQAALAGGNALLGNVAAIRRSEADEYSELAAQRSTLQREYQRQIAEAIAANEADRAAALYEEAKRVDQSLVTTAVNQAEENYRAWKARYG